MDWGMITAIGTVLSALVVFVGAIVVIHELDHMARDRYCSVTNTLLQ
jgi:hypothetical protein